MKRIFTAAIALVLALALLMGIAYAEDASFDDIFTNRNIVHETAEFPKLKYYGFATVTDDGMVDCVEFWSKRDKVHEMIYTMGHPVQGMNSAQKQWVEIVYKGSLSQIEKEDFCTIDYQMGDDYYMITVHYTDMTDKYTIERMGYYGMMEDKGANYISAKMMAESFRAQGYLEKK